jgi:hypothetical protein
MKKAFKIASAIGVGVMLLLLPAAPSFGATFADTATALDQTVTAVAVGTAIAGVLTPFIAALLNQPKLTSQQKAMIAASLGLVLGVVAVGVTGGFVALPWTQWGAQILAVVGVSQTLYSFILKPTGAADAIERASTLDSNVG